MTVVILNYARISEIRVGLKILLLQSFMIKVMLCKKQRKGEGNRRQLALLQSKEGSVHQLCYTLCPLAALQKGKLLCLSSILSL